MNKNADNLRIIIRETLKEANLRMSREGKSAKFASEVYINEVEKDLEELVKMRERRPRGTRERYVIHQAVQHLRNSLNRAKKTRKRLEVIKQRQEEKEKLLVSEEV